MSKLLRLPSLGGGDDLEESPVLDTNEFDIGRLVVPLEVGAKQCFSATATILTRIALQQQ